MDLMSIIIWLVVGAIAGWLAGNLMRGGGFGLIGNIIIGIVGSVIGGWVFGMLGLGGAVTGFNIMSIVTAVVGAAILLFVIGLIKR